MVSVESLGNTALNIVLIISGVVMLILVGVAVGYFVRRKMRFNQFVCIIWEKDGLGNVAQRTDKAGIFVDSATQNKRFFIKNANVGLEPDNIPYVQMGKTKYVYLVRTGLKNFRYIRPRISDDVIHFEVGEEDVNWSINAYERQKVTFSSKKLLQYLPFISLAIVSFVILIIMIYFFKEFNVFRDVAANLKEVVHEAYLIRTYNGSMVIQ